VRISALWHARAVMRIQQKTPQRYCLFRLLLALACTGLPIAAQTSTNHLANATVLVIRHAEKPASGSRLSPDGVLRAQKYAHYFHPFVAEGQRLMPDALYAGADSADSIRPRLTLEPLSQDTGIPLNSTFPTNEPDKLVHALTAEPHGSCVLIAWRHKKIAALLKALGADSATLLPESTWPDDVYDWVIVLHFDAAGHVDQQQRILEPNPLP
jgi:hypothetical protein